MKNMFVRVADLIYRQVYGAGMGVKGGSNLCNLYLSKLELNAGLRWLQSGDPKMKRLFRQVFGWSSRYVDDVFTISERFLKSYLYFDHEKGSNEYGMYPSCLSLEKESIGTKNIPYLLGMLWLSSRLAGYKQKWSE